MKSLMLLNPRRRKARKSRKARRTVRRSRPAASAAPRRRVRRSARRKARVFKARGQSVMLKVNPRRRSFRRGSRSGGGSLMAMGRDLISRDTLMLAGGAIGATAITTIVTSRLGDKLPGVNTTVGGAAYVMGIPLVAAFLVRRWSPALAKGLVIGAAAQGINALAGGAIASAVAKASGTTPTTGTGEYLGRRAVGEYLGRQKSVAGVGYDAINQFSRGVGAQMRPRDAYLGNDQAFRQSAWETPN